MIWLINLICQISYASDRVAATVLMSRFPVHTHVIDRVTSVCLTRMLLCVQPVLPEELATDVLRRRTRRTLSVGSARAAPHSRFDVTGKGKSSCTTLADHRASLSLHVSLDRLMLPCVGSWGAVDCTDGTYRCPQALLPRLRSARAMARCTLRRGRLSPRRAARRRRRAACRSRPSPLSARCASGPLARRRDRFCSARVRIYADLKRAARWARLTWAAHQELNPSSGCWHGIPFRSAATALPHLHGQE